MGDTMQPEFTSWHAYNDFARSIRHERRYVWTTEQAAFLAAVRATTRHRNIKIAKGDILYRAQRGIDWYTSTDDDGAVLDEEPVGYGHARMTPRINQAVEGRANPAGIPVLYLGTTEKTVISEVRPWIGAAVSVAQCKILRPLTAIDLSRGHGKSSLSEIGLTHILNGTEVDAAAKERAVWIDIDNAFSRPVTASDDSAEYVPTQILAELFRDIGYDAIVYKSQFGKKGYNVVLFDPADADVINCAPYEVTAIDVSFKEAGNRWFRSEASGD